MRHAEFENLCRSAQAGEQMHVKHIVTHQIGTLLSCNLNDFECEVDVNGERKTWIAENCLMQKEEEG